MLNLCTVTDYCLLDRLHPAVLVGYTQHKHHDVQYFTFLPSFLNNYITSLMMVNF